MDQHTLYRKIGFIVVIIICLTPIVNPPIALVLGFLFANILSNPFKQESAVAVKWLLKTAIIGLGFGMNIYSAASAGIDGFVLTISTIASVLAFGWLIGKLLNVDPKTSYLVSSGTAICGGSAIAAVAPIIDANPKQISVALGVVFILNALALLIFPYAGHFFELTQHQFGLWCAIAIHDTSSVVGAASTFGPDALETATTIKLGRALWIIPLSLLTVIVNRKKESKIEFPFFILYFIAAMLIGTFLPDGKPVYEILVLIARKILVVTLFLIGAGLSIQVIKSAGGKSMLQGMMLWIIVSISSLVVIKSFY